MRREDHTMPGDHMASSANTMLWAPDQRLAGVPKAPRLR